MFLYIYNDYLFINYYDKNLDIFDINSLCFLSNQLIDLKYNCNCILGHENYLYLGINNSISIISIINEFSIVYTINIHNNRVNCLLIFNNFLISGSLDKSIKIFDINNNYNLIKTLNLKYSIKKMKIHYDILIVLQDTNSMIFFKLDTGIICYRMNNRTNYITDILVFNNYWITYSNEGVKIFDKKYEYKKIKEIIIENLNSVKIYDNVWICLTGKIFIYYDLLNNFDLLIETNVFNIVIKNFFVYKNSLYCYLDDSIKIINLKKYKKNLKVNKILYHYFDIFYKKKFNLIKNLKPIYNLLINESSYTKSVIWNQYFCFNKLVIKYSEKYNLFEQSWDLFGYDNLFFLFNKNEELFLFILKENKTDIFLLTLLYYLTKNNKISLFNYEIFISYLKVIIDKPIIINGLIEFIFKKSFIDEGLKFIKLMNFENHLLFKSKYNKFDEHNYLKLMNLQKKSGLNYNKRFEVFNFCFRFPNRLSENKELFEILIRSSDDIKLSNIKYLIIYFFDNMSYFKFIDLFLFILYIITLSLNWKIKNIGLTIINLIFIIYFFIFEALQIILNFKSYFSKFLNLYGISIIIYNLYIIISLYNNVNNEFEFFVLFYLNGIGLLTKLKSISLIRKQIRLFFKVIENSINFMIFIAIILNYLNIINVLYSKDKDNNFFKSLFTMFSLTIGSFDNNFDTYDLSWYIQVFVNTYIFFIILLNLFISIVSNIFSEYNENQELYDLEEKLFVLKQYSSINYILELINFKILSIFKNKIFLKRNYIFIIKEKPKKLFENLQQFKSEFNSNFNYMCANPTIKINDIQDDVNNLKINIRDLKNLIKNELKKEDNWLNKSEKIEYNISDEHSVLEHNNK